MPKPSKPCHAPFVDCFYSNPGRKLLQIYVQGLLSDVQRKNAEAIAANQNVRPRTLQRFLDSIKWDHERLRDRCQQIIATDHADSQAVGIVDESGMAKSGHDTVGVKRQYNGNRGKIENCIVNVALSFATVTFHSLLDACVYLPKEWTDDPSRRKKLAFLTM